MDGAGKIAAGIVVAVLLAIGWRVALIMFAKHEVDQALSTLSQQQAASAHDYQQRVAADALARRQQVAAEQRSRMLGPSDRCIAGTVVTVSGSTYTQAIGPHGRPVGCAGRYRLR